MESFLSLQEFTSKIKSTLKDQMGGSYWVVAEIASIQIARQGHAYLELIEKKDDLIVSKIRANIWAGQFQSIQSQFIANTGEQLKSGMHILCSAVINYHEVYGLSINLLAIDPNYTLGERAKKRQQIIDQLNSEGLMDKNKQLRLAPVMQHIAIISSSTAAGYEDFLNQLTRNNYGYAHSTRLFDSVVQGDQAPASITKAFLNIQQSASKFDVVVLIRGGGSQIDLDCFDNYAVASAIANCSIPVFTGIGHQRDETIADLVAHTTLKTPTAVAEQIIDAMLVFEETLLNQYESISKLVKNRLRQENERNHHLKFNLLQLGKRYFLDGNNQLKFLKERITVQSKRVLQSKKHHLEILQKDIEANNPERIFAKGYSMTFLNNKLVKKNHLPQEGDLIQTINNQYIIQSTVKNIKSTENE